MSQIESATRLLTVLALSLTLAACGGGTKDTAKTDPQAKPGVSTPPPTETKSEPAKETPKEVEPPRAGEPKHETPPADDKKPAPDKPKEPEREAFAIRVLTVPAGTALHLCLQNEISTKNETAGQAFDATTKGDVMIGGAKVIPEGSTVKGEVTLAKRAPKVGGKAQLALEVHQLTTPDGKTYRLFANPLQLEGESTTTGDVEKVVGGAVGGAILGGILGGKSGALKGAAGGAAAGGVWAVATRGKDIVLSPNQEMEFILAREIGVTAKVPVSPLP